MSIRAELELTGPRPVAGTRAEKKNYAERLSRRLAVRFANSLRGWFDGISPDEDGGRQEKPARTAKGVKKLDVNYSTAELGLGLGVSIKTINFPDDRTGRYTKNFTRVDNELRAEAKDYHQRQPYAVLVGVLYLPSDACRDGSPPNGAPSSFGEAVRHLRHRSNRVNPTNEEELFERFFIGIYEPDGPTEGADWYFDVMAKPPRHGRPVQRDRLPFEKVIGLIRGEYDRRNNPPFEWAEDSDWTALPYLSEKPRARFFRIGLTSVRFQSNVAAEIAIDHGRGVGTAKSP